VRESRSVEVVWTRSRRSDKPDERQSVRIRQNDGAWQEVGSTEDLPDDVQELLADFISKAGSGEFTLDSEVQTVPPRTVTPRRQRVRTTESNDALELEYVWFNPWRLILAVICVPALLYLAYDLWRDQSRWSLALAVLMLAAVLFILYLTATLLLNRTTFIARHGRLTVRHGPLPLFGNASIEEEDVRQLYVRVRRTRRHRRRYQLGAVTAAGDDVTLLDDVRSRAEAVQLERAIERHLDIADWPDYAG
jgi:hypothetical protein